MEIWIKIVAVLVAMFMGHPILSWLTDGLRELTGEPKKIGGGRTIAKYLGLFERAIVVLIWFWGRPEFIGFWFAGKVIGDWKRTDKEKEGSFSGFLLATGTSILFAIVIGILAEWILASCFKAK